MSPKVRKWIAIIFLMLAIGFLYLVHEVLLPFVISGIFVYLLAPAVDYLSQQRLFRFQATRGISVLLIYAYLLITVALIGLLVVPPLYEEVLKIAQDIPQRIEHFRTVALPAWIDSLERLTAKTGLNLDIEEYVHQTVENMLRAGEGQLESLTEYTQKFLKVLFSALTTFLVIFIVTAFVLIDLPRIKTTTLKLIPSRYRKAALSLAKSIDRDLSGVIRGQLAICLVNGTLTTVALLILKVKFAITIGVIAGIFSLIPVFGAIISTIPAVLIAMTQSLVTALAVVGVIVAIHLLEANYLNPKILGHTVDLHPAIIVFAIIVGEHFFGPVGLLFGVPVAAIIRSLLSYFYRQVFIEPDTESNGVIKVITEPPPETESVSEEPRERNTPQLTNQETMS